MQKKLFFGFMAMIIASNAMADISITIPGTCELSALDYYYAPIKQFAAAKTRAERGIESDSVKFVNFKAEVRIPKEADSYLFGLNLNNNNIPVYAKPGENIIINVTNCNPFQYTISGTGLVDGMNELLMLEAPVQEKAKILRQKEDVSEAQWDDLSSEYNTIQKEFICANPENPAVGIALMNLDGEDFINVYEALPDKFNNSILFPLVAKQYENIKKNVELEKKQQVMQSGEVQAPNFTLKDLEGKEVSLSDFRGKWVILDFWGSWCPWCIKGFPELKEAYSKYAGKLEIIGIDCRESESDWRAGVEKYQLPWVNVYNPESSNLTNEYGVQGYPTKTIIDPDGKIKNITVGHNPAFFKILSNLIIE